ncbi:uncharacterized protein [Drosophila pseudoobscura]|uniref:Uncharacterized protein n=1 Tax=Drosophila pseudoobscura pseudoobscura TaxID=46245 RepID=A0A6I8V1X4_DROPS|nr:uncharacterized protein LOC6896728 [Drosophila pseudoobscura]
MPKIEWNTNELNKQPLTDRSPPMCYVNRKMRTVQVVLVKFLLSPLLILAGVQTSEFRDAMKKMDKNMKIAIQMGNELERYFDQATGSPGQKVFNIKPAKNALIRFSYSKPQGHQDSESTNGKRRPSVSASSATSKRRQQPKYFLNFNFKNHRRSKTDVDQPSTTVQPRTGRARQNRLRNGMPNPFKYFPLKGENI